MRPTPRVLIFLFVLTCILPLLHGSPRADGTGVTLRREYDAGRLQVRPTDEGVAVAWGDLPLTERLGTPSLPVDRITVHVPEGMQITDVRTRVRSERDLPLPAAPAPYRGSAGVEDPEVRADPSVYQSAKPYPRAIAEVISSGVMRGRRLETVEVRPVRYDATAQALRIAERVDLEIVFGPEEESDAVRPRDVAWADPGGFSRAVERAVTLPPETMPLFTRHLSPLTDGGEPFSPRFLPSEEGSPVRFLILCADAFEEEFRKLADWKTALGMPTVVRTASWVYANYPRGVDHAEDIRSFIREAVEKWGVEYVLLGGDTEVFPFRYGKSYFYGGEFIPTDMYFACLDGNWNRNGNDLFGEGYVNNNIPGDAADLYPDVWVGRAPVRTAAEAATFVTKVKNYERLAPLSSGFADRFLALGEMLFPQSWSEGDTVIMDGAQLCETAVARLDPGIAPYRMYENTGGYAGSVLLYREGGLAQINAGYNFVLHVGHGYRNTMSLGYNGETIVNADADGLYNHLRQGLLYAINCTSSAFDFDCIAEHFLRNPSGGAVSSVGSTRYDFPATGWNYQDEFFTLVFSDGVTRLGEAAAEQKVPFVPLSGQDSEQRWTQFSLVYMGDPTIDLYTDTVQELTASVVEPLELGAGTYTVQVNGGGGPLEGAVVCLNKAGDSYATGVTDVNGEAVLSFSPDFPGKVSFGVRAHNFRSVVDTLQVASPIGPHLFVSEMTVDDTAGGDGDGRLEAGETAFIIPVIGNQGLGAAANVSLTVVGTPPEITLLDGTAACPGVLPDSSEACSDPIEIAVAAGTPDVTRLSMDVTLAATGYSRTEPVGLFVGGPKLHLSAAALRDTTGNGNGDGAVDPGEDQHLRVTMRNLGLGRATGLTATLSSTDPAVQILDGTSVYGDLESDASSGGDGFLVRFTDGDPDHPIEFIATDDQGDVSSQTLQLASPAAPLGLVAKGGATSIELRWTPVSSGDLAGYHVYRATSPGGAVTRVNPLRTGRVSYFNDEDLPPLTRFYYKVAAVDSSGVESGLSGEAEATTSLSAAQGFPFELGAATACSPCLAFLNGDIYGDIVTGAGEICAITHSGEEFIDGDGDTRTYGVFSNSGFGPYWAPPAVGDMDVDGIQEIVGVTWSAGLLYVWNGHGGVKSGWPQSLVVDHYTPANVWGAPVLADLDNDGDLEVVVNAGQYTFAFHHDGSEVADGDNDPATKGVLIKMGATYTYSTPAVADVDNDGVREVISTSRDGKLYVVNPDGTALPGFPYATGGDITNSPAVGDLDNDGWKEIVFANSVYKVYALNVNLQQPPGWPTAANMNMSYDASPALADMDRDGFLDVVLCAGNGTVYLWHGQNGQLFPGWGFVLYDANGAKVPLVSSPAVGNLDADSDYEVCFGGNNGSLYAFNLDASLVDGFPIGTANAIEGGPLLWDLDADGYTDVVAHSDDQNLYVWHSPGVFDPDDQPWPMFHRNSHRTGDVDGDIWHVTGVEDRRPPSPSFLLSPNYPNPFAASTAITYRLPEEAAGGVEVNLTVFDASGRRVATLAEGTEYPGLHRVDWDGRAADGRRVSAGIYFYRLTAGPETATRKLVLLP